MSDHELAVWVVYDHPTDFPDHYVARQHFAGAKGVRPSDEVMQAVSIGTIRRAMIDRGLTRVERSDVDDPKIVESWL